MLERERTALLSSLDSHRKTRRAVVLSEVVLNRELESPLGLREYALDHRLVGNLWFSGS
jgi:hypothetical protein